MKIINKENLILISIILLFILFIIFCLAVIYQRSSKYDKYENKSLEQEEKVSYQYTYTWPPQDLGNQKELDQNPFCSDRKSYCESVGYKYDNTLCDCEEFEFYQDYSSYINNEAGFTIYYPKLWEVSDSQKELMYMSDMTFTIQRDKAGCFISYGLIDKEKLITPSRQNLIENIKYDKDSGGFISSDEGALTRITLYDDNDLSYKQKASGQSRIYNIAIPSFPTADYQAGFILQSSNQNNTLSEVCISEFDAIINSYSKLYKQIKLDSSATGTIFFQDTASSFEKRANILGKRRLLLNNDRDLNIVQISDEDFQGDIDEKLLFLSGGKLFFVEKTQKPYKIRYVDLYSGERKYLDIPYQADKLVHSFFVRNDMIYYIEGSECIEYEQECNNMELKSYSIKSGQVKTYTNQSKSRHINGFSEDKKKLILSWNEGDELCVWGSYESVNLNNGDLLELGEYGYCFDEGDANPDSYTKFLESFSGVDQFQYLTVVEGKIYTSDKQDEDVRFFIKVNTDEYKPAGS